MNARTLPALLLALAVPALAAPNRPPADNSYCITNQTDSTVSSEMRIQPAQGSPVPRTLVVGARQSSCVIGPAGQVKFEVSQFYNRPCSLQHDASAGQARIDLRVGVVNETTWRFTTIQVLTCAL